MPLRQKKLGKNVEKNAFLDNFSTDSSIHPFAKSLGTILDFHISIICQGRVAQYLTSCGAFGAF